MYYRRKVILALIQLFEGSIDKISLQKLLFLFTQHQSNPTYDFVPYRYGCYSYSANADLLVMEKKGILLETMNRFIINEKTEYIKALKEEDRKIMLKIRNSYGKMSANSLMKYTYINFPYWAINSIKAKEILTELEIEKVKESRPINEENTLFTIGYEGISLEEYLNRLIKNDVKVLVDVRRNPLSMKFGFSKVKLQRYCNSLGIEYVHFPDVGIQSEERRELNTQNDYDKLFANYCKSTLTKTTTSQLKIIELLEKYQRIALTCFEADICQCHRKHLAEAIENLADFQYRIKHI